MNSKPFEFLARATLCLLACSCDGELLVGEEQCFGEGVDCGSKAPTFSFPEHVDVFPFDATPSRSVEPVWIYDSPTEYPWTASPELAPAPGGGVWMSRDLGALELSRIDADGEPVELHTLNYGGYLTVDDELRPTLLRWPYNGQVVQTLIGPSGEIVERPVGPAVRHGFSPSLKGYFPLSGPEGRVRTVVFRERGSYLAEYDPLGELTWRQSDLRIARVPAQGGASTLAASYSAVALSDGSIALAVPKPGLGDRSPSGVAGLSGLNLSELAQGITLVGPNGNVRWDITLGTPNHALLAPGLDGGVVYASSQIDGLAVTLVDRDGGVRARWSGQHVDFHGAFPSAICADSAGDAYVLMLTGRRRAPVPTVCRMRADDPSAEVECLGVEGAVEFPDEPSGVMLRTMTAPEPGAVVFSLEQTQAASETAITRLVRVEF